MKYDASTYSDTSNNEKVFFIGSSILLIESAFSIQYCGLSKRNGVTFLTYYFPIISRTMRARKFVQAPFDAARHALFML